MRPGNSQRIRKPHGKPESARSTTAGRRGGKRARKTSPYLRLRQPLPEEGVLAAETLRTPAAVRELQQTVGNQLVTRLADGASASGLARQPAESTPPAGEQSESAGFRFAGASSRHIRSLEDDTHFQEAHATTMSEIRVWERRQSRRTLRTAEQSAEFYDWLEKKVANFPGRIHLTDNQYWELSPGSGRLRLVTVHVVQGSITDEEQAPLPGSAEATEDPIYARYYAIYGSHAPWVTPDVARMRVQQADPEEARRMRVRELLPQYLMWASIGGERREEDYKVPATWYLSQQPERANWSLQEYFTLKAMHGASERMRAMPVLAEASANLTNFILAFPVVTIEELAKEGLKFAGEYLFDQMLDYLERNRLVSEEVLNSLRVSKEAILGLLDFKSLFEALISDDPDVDKGQEAIDFVGSLFGHASAIAEVARGEGGPSPVVEVGQDDAGFWSECGQTRLQEKYFYHFVAANLTFLRAYLAGEGVTDEDVYMVMAREVERIRGNNPLMGE